MTTDAPYLEIKAHGLTIRIVVDDVDHDEVLGFDMTDVDEELLHLWSIPRHKLREMQERGTKHIFDHALKQAAHYTIDDEIKRRRLRGMWTG